MLSLLSNATVCISKQHYYVLDTASYRKRLTIRIFKLCYKEQYKKTKF